MCGYSGRENMSLGIYTERIVVRAYKNIEKHEQILHSTPILKRSSPNPRSSPSSLARGYSPSFGYRIPRHCFTSNQIHVSGIRTLPEHWSDFPRQRQLRRRMRCPWCTPRQAALALPGTLYLRRAACRMACLRCLHLAPRPLRAAHTSVTRRWRGASVANSAHCAWWSAHMLRYCPWKLVARARRRRDVSRNF